MDIESNTASIEPKTDMEPFIPYIQGINSFSPFLFRISSKDGNGIPRKNPKGNIKTKVTIALNIRLYGNK